VVRSGRNGNTSDQEEGTWKKARCEETKSLLPTTTDQVNYHLMCHSPRCHSAKNFHGTTGLIWLRDMQSAAEDLSPFQRQFNIYQHTWESTILAREPSQKLNEKAAKRQEIA
jgi:hypothetical protein